MNSLSDLDLKIPRLDEDDDSFQAIKDQGLACVDGLEEKEETVEENIADEVGLNDKDSEGGDGVDGGQPTIIELETISLNSKDIKSEDDSELEGSNYAVYSFIAFCFLLAVLFAVKKWNKKYWS